MPRRFLPALASVLLSACATQPPRTPQTLQVTGNRPLYRTYWQTGDAVYVRVQAGSPDALLLAEPDPWAETVGMLAHGQRLTVLNERTGNYVQVRTWGLGVEMHGWVARAAVGTRAPELSDAERRKLEQEGASRSRTFCTRLPGETTMDSSSAARALAGIDEHETDLNRLLGGDPLNPDPARARARFRAFGEQGGLLGD